MKYDHIVVAYGKYYAAGEEVPESDPRDADIVFETDAVANGATASPTKRGRPSKKTAE